MGDILFKDDFSDLVVQPMLSRVLGDQFVSGAPLQKKNYDDPGFIPSTKDKIDSEFWETWAHEMQFDLDAARHIIGALAIRPPVYKTIEHRRSDEYDRDV